MEDLRSNTNEQLIWELLFAALRHKDERIHGMATELLGRLGQAPLQRLLSEVHDRKNPRGYRLRILGVIARIGTIVDPNRLFELGMLRRDPNAAIREASIQVLLSLRPDPTIPLESVAMIATNRKDPETDVRPEKREKPAPSAMTPGVLTRSGTDPNSTARTPRRPKT